MTYTSLSSDEGDEYLAEVPRGRYAAAYRFVNKNTGEATEMVKLNVLGVALQVVAGGAEEATAVYPTPAPPLTERGTRKKAA